MRQHLAGVIAGTPITLDTWSIDASHGEVTGDFSGYHPDLDWDPFELVDKRLMFLFFNGKKIAACGHAFIQEVSIEAGNREAIRVKGTFTSRENWTFIG